MVDIEHWSGNDSPINLNIKFEGLGKKDKSKMRKHKSGAAIVDACKFKISHPRDYSKRNNNFNFSPDMSPFVYEHPFQFEENNFIESRKATNHHKVASDGRDPDDETYNIIGNVRESMRARARKHAAPKEQTPNLSTG